MIKTVRAQTLSPELPEPPAFLVTGGGGGGNFSCEEVNGVTSPAGDYPCAPSLGTLLGQLCPAWPGGASPLWHMKSYSMQLQSCEPSSQAAWCELSIIPPIPVALLGADITMSLPQRETEFKTLIPCELLLPPRKASLCQM